MNFFFFFSMFGGTVSLLHQDAPTFFSRSSVYILRNKDKLFGEIKRKNSSRPLKQIIIRETPGVVSQKYNIALTLHIYVFQSISNMVWNSCKN
jgi:hypothetical protein